jgi:hypothetical protein
MTYKERDRVQQRIKRRAGILARQEKSTGKTEPAQECAGYKAVCWEKSGKYA